MLSTVLIPALQQRFPNRRLRTGSPPDPVAVFPSTHPDVGNIEIYDDGAELTVVAGRFTHGHFSTYDDALSPAQKELRIVDAVVDFLDQLFADRVILWGTHKTGGGWYLPERVGPSPRHHGEYVWSGPRPQVD